MFKNWIYIFRYNFGFGGTGIIRVRANGILINLIKNNLDLVNNYKINSFTVPY